METIKYKPMDNETVVHANTAARRLMENINSREYTPKEMFQLYHVFMELFRIIYNKNNNDASFALNSIHAVCSMADESLGLEQKASEAHILVWGILMTSDETGMECSIEQFMACMKMKFGSQNSLVRNFASNAESLWHSYSDMEIQTYRFEFVFDFETCIITFSSIIPESVLEHILTQLKINRHSIRKYEKCIKSCMEQYHLKYRDFHAEYLSDGDKRNLKHLLRLYTGREHPDAFRNHIMSADNQYSLIDGHWNDSDGYYHGCIAVKKLSFGKPICRIAGYYSYTDYDDYSDTTHYIVAALDINDYSQCFLHPHENVVETHDSINEAFSERFQMLLEIDSITKWQQIADIWKINDDD